MFKVVNYKNEELNILHFQGKNIDILPKTFKTIYSLSILNPLENNLSIISCWTDNNKCYLYQQLSRFNIKLINALPDNYDYYSKWDMRNKIQFYIDCLKTKVNTDIVLLLDGYDVLFSSTNNIIEKFKTLGYKIIFNATANKYPDEDIDFIENRDQYGRFKYLNAGCCIGYKEDLIKFYTECLNYINIPNLYNSEQKIIRTCFSNYSNDKNQKFIWIDFDRKIFQTMAFTKCDYNSNTKILTIVENQDIV